jgi:ribose/xylose/arabinose/galactoside ABC-type transport system permease subunit
MDPQRSSCADANGLPADLPARPDAPSRLAGVLRAAGPFLGLAVILGIFTLLEPAKFANTANARTIITQSSVVAVCALGATLVIISGGIDLSVGSIVGVVAVATALLLKAGWNPAAAGLAGVGVGALCGLLNGVLVTTLKIVPFIVTLGTMQVFRGLAIRLGGDQNVNAVPPWSTRTEEPAWFYHLMTISLPDEMSWMVLAPGVWITVAAAIGTAVLLRYTVLGRYIFAVGGNETASRFCGINVERTRLAVYTLGGLAGGVAGVLSLGDAQVGEVRGGEGLELSVIAAVVIGGASLAGGRGGVTGTMVGALLVRALTNGCNKANISNSVQLMLIGALIIVAVAVDQVRRRWERAA